MRSATWSLKLPVYVNDRYSAPDIHFETIKKAMRIAEWISHTPGLLDRLELCDPANNSEAMAEALVVLERFVDPDYLVAIRTGEPAGLAASNGLGWDPTLFEMVVNSTAGILCALRDVLRGEFAAASLSSGLHHASPDSGAGFCTVNSLAVASLVAASEGLRVVILDLDAHCGGGTHAYLRQFPELSERITHLDVSVSSFDRYQPEGFDSLLEITDEDHYLEAVEGALRHVVAAAPDVVFYNAGVDIWPTVSPEVVARRDQVVASELHGHGTRCVIVMAGGYGDDNKVIPLHVGTLLSFAEIQCVIEDSPIRCSDCGGKILPIVYGYPTGATMDRYFRGEISLGGCLIFPEQPSSRCSSCGKPERWLN